MRLPQSIEDILWNTALPEDVCLHAEEVDQRLRTFGRLADVSHRAMAFYLADIDRRGLYQVLGAPSTVAYGTRALGLSRWAVWRLLTSGRKLQELMIVDRAFADGQLPWSKVRLLDESDRRGMARP